MPSSGPVGTILAPRARRTLMISVLLILVGLLIIGCGRAARRLERGAPVGSAPSAGTPGPAPRTVSVGAMTREYWIYRAAGAPRDRPAPLLIALHGGGGNPQRFWEASRLNQTAAELGFTVVYPAGSGRTRLLTWNAGGCCAYAQRQNVDDVGFIAAMLEAVSREFGVDRRRVYATGVSNGGMMAQRLACELSDRIAAVASVAGPLVASRCSPARPVSVLSIHGTADTNVPYQGGTGSGITRTDFPPVTTVMSDWARRNGCERTVPARTARAGLLWQAWGPCRDGTDVALGTREGGTHEWLSSENTLIWEFLAGHQLVR